MNFVPKPNVKYYFASWSGYEVPLIPRRLVNYEEANKLSAYCEATFDTDGRVKIFRKWFCDHSGDEVVVRLSFEHYYEYFPNGHLRLWKWQEKDKAPGEKIFERNY